MSIGAYIIVVSFLCHKHSHNNPQFKVCIIEMAECINKDKAHLNKFEYCKSNVEYFR